MLGIGVVFSIRAASDPADAASSRATAAATHQPIEQVRLGRRLVARNPLRNQTRTPSDITPDDWRQVDLEAVLDGVLHELSFLRPVSWIDEQAAADGSTIEMRLPEVGLDGPVRVVRISDCPEIEPDDGSGRRVVTGTMRHAAGDIRWLTIEGESRPLGVTATHPIWSEDRLEFVPAGELRVGERLRRSAPESDPATARIIRITPHTGPPVMVYNLEVDAEHVYNVGSTCLLVHNNCPGDLASGGAATLPNTTMGWRVGDPINNLTASGNVPSWSAVRGRFWKNEAHLHPGNYSEADLARIRKGLAPQRVNPETGKLESMELHHAPPQREGGLFDVTPVWPIEHAGIDPRRRLGGN